MLDALRAVAGGRLLLVRARSRLLDAFETAALETDDAVRKQLLQFVVAPGSLHSGVRFRPLPPPAAAKTAAAHATTEAATACFVLEPPLASLGPCFARHRSVGATLLDHGSAGSLLSCLLLGRDLLPSPAREVLLERPPRRSQDRSLAARQRTAAGLGLRNKRAPPKNTSRKKVQDARAVHQSAHPTPSTKNQVRSGPWDTSKREG